MGKEQQGSAVSSSIPNMIKKKDQMGNSQSNAQLTQQMATTSRRLEYLERRDKRIQELCKEWQDKITADPSIDAKPFVTSINTIIFSGNKFKTRVKVISSAQTLELFDFEMHPEDKNQAWISNAYCAVENLGEVKNVRSMSIAPETAISMIKCTSGRRESISAALLAGKMKPMTFNKNAIIEEDEEEEEQEDVVSRKASNASALRATKSQPNNATSGKSATAKSTGGKSGNKAQSGACSIQ